MQPCVLTVHAISFIQWHPKFPFERSVDLHLVCLFITKHLKIYFFSHFGTAYGIETQFITLPWQIGQIYIWYLVKFIHWLTILVVLSSVCHVSMTSGVPVIVSHCSFISCKPNQISAKLMCSCLFSSSWKLWLWQFWQICVDVLLSFLL